MDVYGKWTFNIWHTLVKVPPQMVLSTSKNAFLPYSMLHSSANGIYITPVSTHGVTASVLKAAGIPVLTVPQFPKKSPMMDNQITNNHLPTMLQGLFLLLHTSVCVLLLISPEGKFLEVGWFLTWHYF